jgi:hypothetical protein
MGSRHYSARRGEATRLIPNKSTQSWCELDAASERERDSRRRTLSSIRYRTNWRRRERSRSRRSMGIGGMSSHKVQVTLGDGAAARKCREMERGNVSNRELEIIIIRPPTSILSDPQTTSSGTRL